MDTYFYSAFIYFRDGTTGHGDGIVPYDRSLLAKEFDHVKEVMIRGQLQSKFNVQIDYFALIQFNKI